MRGWGVVSVIIVPLLAVTAAACSPAHPPGSLAFATTLDLQPKPSAFDTVAGGAGLVRSIHVGGNCAVSSHNAFVPPGKTGEAAGGEGNPINYPEVLELSWNCGNASTAQRVFRVMPMAQPGRSVSGVGDQALVLDDSDNAASGFVGDRVFFVAWQRGPRVGTVELAGPGNDKSLTATVAERLAEQMAG